MLILLTRALESLWEDNLFFFLLSEGPFDHVNDVGIKTGNRDPEKIIQEEHLTYHN